jgi:hypothetical protein
MGTLEDWQNAHLKGNKKATEKILREQRSKARRFSDQWVRATLTLVSQLTARKHLRKAKPLIDELAEAINRKRIVFSEKLLLILMSRNTIPL